MSKKNNNKKLKVEDLEKLYSIEKIILASQFTKKERIMYKLYMLTAKWKVNHIAVNVYGYYIYDNRKTFSTHKDNKNFVRIVKEEYCIAKVLGDFTDFHAIMCSKCSINDMNWRNYLTEKGEIISAK